MTPKHTIFTAVALLAASLTPGCSQETAESTVMSFEVPAAAGSVGANLATGPDGAVVLSWIEPDGDGHRLQYSVLAEAGWTEAATVARGDNWFVNWADFPSVVPLSGQLWAAHWLASQPEGGYAYDVNLSISEDHGRTWSTPFLPHFDATATEHGFVTLYPDSNGVGLVWLDGRKMINEYDENDVRASGMTLRAATFGTDQAPIRSALVDDLTCDCCQTDLALTDDGPVAVYRDRTTDEIRDIYVARREFGEWQPGVPVASDRWEIAACPVNGPVIRANGNDVAVAWFTAAGDAPMVKAAWSQDGGRTFAAPVIVSRDVPLGHVGAVMLAGGDLVVSYQRSIGNGGAELLLRRISVSGAASEPYAVPGAADVFAFSVPQLAMRGDELVVAWTNSIDDEYSVGATLFPVAALGEMAAPTVSPAQTAVSALFDEAGVEGTLVVQSLNGEDPFVHNAARAATPFSPASTFKIPNTLIALEAGVVTSKDSAFDWDGTDRGVAQWNQDQTLDSAFKVSCVWCYQEIARAVGADAYTAALAALDYGNQEIGDQVDQFWLNGDLEISAVDQVAFLEKLVNDKLPYDRAQVDLLKEIMLVEETTDYALYAKTGWTGSELAVGWYVGFVTTTEGTWLFAMNIHMTDAGQAPLRKELAVKALRALDIL
jgi:beta-lactamase class D